MERYFVAKDKGSLCLKGRLFLPGAEVPIQALERLPRESIEWLFDHGLIISVGEVEAVEDEKIGFKSSKMEKEEGVKAPEYEKLSLDELNLLVKEKDPEMEPFETVEEAIAFLRM